MATPTYITGDIHQTWESVSNSFDCGTAADGSDRYLIAMVQQDRSTAETLLTPTYNGSSMTVLASGTHTFLGRDWLLAYLSLSGIEGSKTFVAGGTGSDSFQTARLLSVWANVNSSISGMSVTAVDDDSADDATHEFTISSATGDLAVAILTDLGSNRTISSVNGTNAYEEQWLAGSTRGVFVTKAGASSVTLGVTWSGQTDDCGVLFSLPATGGGGSALPILMAHYS